MSPTPAAALQLLTGLSLPQAWDVLCRLAAEEPVAVTRAVHDLRRVDREAVRREVESRLPGATREQRDHRGQPSALGGYRPLNP